MLLWLHRSDMAADEAPRMGCQGHALWSSPGVIITPHIGGAVARMRERGYRLVTKQIRRHLAGEPLQNKVILD